MRWIVTSLTLPWLLVGNARSEAPTTAPSARHDAVRISQIGYFPQERKRIVVVGQGQTTLHVRNLDTGKTIATFTSPTGKLDPDSGDTTSVVELTGITAPGRYIIEVDGQGKSDEFELNAKVYDRPLRLSMLAFYGQRCGTAVSLAPEFPQYKYPACHTGPATYHASTGKQGTNPCTHGWHDAGDYNRYVVNSGITTGTLLMAWEAYQKRLADMRLHASDAVPAIPDYLAEVKWNLDWMLQMQDGDGGVFHKATAAQFSGMVMPQDDKAPVLIVGSGVAPYKTTQATADFGAVCAIAARAYRRYDPEYAAKCLAAARKAYDWAIAHPNAPFTKNPEGIQTGGYGDPHPQDELLWLAAELFRTTNEATYHKYFLSKYKNFSPLIPPTGPQNWGGVQNLAFFTYLMSESADAAAAAEIKAALLGAADACVNRGRKNGYHIPMEESDYVWGSNSVVANYGMMLQVAYKISGNREYFDAAQDCLHYLLGRSTFNMSFITQIGKRWPMHPHHRPSAADGIEQPWPGMLVGGPNKDNNKRPVARQWFDNEGDYRTNEIAINWNAPLVYLLAAAASEAK